MTNRDWVVEELPDEVKKEIEEKASSKKEKKKLTKRAKKRYKEIQMDPGESIGIVTAQSLGEPGTQMSIDSKEKVIVKRSGQVKITEIGRLVDRLMDKYPPVRVGKSEVLPLKNSEIYVPSLSESEKIKWKKVTECSRHIPNKKLIKITTSSGREITCTDNHSFVTRENNEIVPVLGKELEEGDRIPVIGNLPENCIGSIAPAKLVSKETQDKVVKKEGNLYFPKSETGVPEKIKLDESFGYFIGAYLAEGSCGNGEIGISNFDGDFLNNIEEFANSFGFNYRKIFREREYGWGCDLKIRNSVLCEFIKDTCNTGSSRKKVPQFAYSAEQEFVSGLLRGYFDGDGNVHTQRKMVRASSNSEELIKGISLLLTRSKIFSLKHKDKKAQHWLLIPYKYAPDFLEKIGSSIKSKEKSLEELSSMSEEFWNNKSQDYTDMISGFGDLIYETARKVGMKTRYVNNFTKRQKIGRTPLFRYIKKFEKLSEEKGINIDEEIEIMKRMFYSDVIWDSIENIEYVESNGHVYDFSVDGLETFTTFDGIVTHNTMRTFHFAGVSALNVTLGLPRVIELLDARKNPKTPVMTVYLKKDIEQDEEKAKEVANKIKECRLIEITKELKTDLVNSKIVAKIDKEIMKERGLTLKKVAKAVNKRLRGASGKKITGGVEITVSSDKIKRAYRKKRKAKRAAVSGIKGVTQALPSKEGEGDDAYYIIKTAGSNLKKVLKIPEVDETRTRCNDIHEVKRVLGIEAARSAIIEEITDVLEKQQGFDVDFRYINLIADTMCHSGEVNGITRHGIIKGKRSVLARASFETPINHLVDASVIGEKDRLTSVVENVMLNQEAPVGTGLPRLKVKKEDEE